MMHLFHSQLSREEMSRVYGSDAPAASPRRSLFLAATISGVLRDARLAARQSVILARARAQLERTPVIR